MRKAVKVPVVMQMESAECGAACLCMVLAYYGKWLPLERARLDCGVGRDGGSAGDLLKAARGHGLRAQGYRCGPEGLGKLPPPLILHWGFNHFVVFCGFRGRAAVLCDPARGRVEEPAERLDEAFTGVALAFEPTGSFEPEGRPRGVLAFLRPRLRGALAPFLFAVSASLLTAAAGLASPLFARVFLDEILSGKNPGWLRPFLAALAGLVAYQAAASLLQTACLLKIEGGLAARANAQFMWHVLRLPVEFFSQRYAGDIAMRQRGNELIAGTLISRLGPVALHLGMAAFYLCAMLRVSPMLAAVGLTAAALNLSVARRLSQKRVNLARVQMRDAGKLAAATVSGIEMIETIKAGGAENGFFERWSGLNARVSGSEAEFSGLGSAIEALLELLARLADTAVLLLGAALILRGRLTTGLLLAFQGFLSAFLTPVGALLDLGRELQEARVSMERVEDVMGYPPDVEDGEPLGGGGEARPLEKLAGGIVMREVSFGYRRLAPPLIEGFSLTLRPGGTVALVGPSGCGKSTLAKLISGLYRPWSGEILYDGKPLGQIPRAVFTGSLAVVDQQITLFEDTVAENLRLWDKSVEDFEILLAARDARVHEDIAARAGGYNAVIRENGKNFSGGQRQRLEIARALAQDPTVIVLDEATSALDTRTEREVLCAVRERGITCVIVAHRLSTIRDCDEIIVLENGRVAERGTHEELYARGGAYTRLISME